MQIFIKCFLGNFPWQDFFPDISLILTEIPDISPTAGKFPNISLFPCWWSSCIWQSVTTHGDKNTQPSVTVMTCNEQVAAWGLCCCPPHPKHSVFPARVWPDSQMSRSLWVITASCDDAPSPEHDQAINQSFATDWLIYNYNNNNYYYHYYRPLSAFANFLLQLQQQSPYYYYHSTTATATTITTTTTITTILPTTKNYKNNNKGLLNNCTQQLEVLRWVRQLP